MKLSIVVGSFLIVAPTTINAHSYFPRIFTNLFKNDIEQEEADYTGMNKRSCSSKHPSWYNHIPNILTTPETPASSGMLDVLKDKLVASLGPYQEILGVEDSHSNNKERRDAAPKVTKEEASAVQKWMELFTKSEQHAEIARAFIGSNSRIMGRNYDGADEHRVVLSKYIDIIRNCPMFSTHSEEISIPQGELDDNNFCRVAFGDVVLRTKDTADTVVSKLKEWKNKLIHQSLKTKRDRGFSFWNDFGEPMEKREDFWTQIIESPEEFKIQDDTEVKTTEKGRTFEKRDIDLDTITPDQIQQIKEEMMNNLFESGEKYILTKAPYESDYKRKEAWEEFQGMKKIFKEQYYSKTSTSTSTISKRDWFDDLKNMGKEFADEWNFLDREEGEDEKEEEEVEKENNHWKEDWDKMKEDFLEEWGDNEKVEKRNQKRSFFDRGDPENPMKEDTPQELRAEPFETKKMLEPWKRSWWCPWCSDPTPEPQFTHHEIFPGIEIDIPITNDQNGDTAPNGWLWDEIRAGLINIGGTLEDVKNTSVEPQNLSPSAKEIDEVGDAAPSGWLWDEIRDDLINIEGTLVDKNDIIDINLHW